MCVLVLVLSAQLEKVDPTDSLSLLQVFFYGTKVFSSTFIGIIHPGASLVVTWEYNLVRSSLLSIGLSTSADSVPSPADQPRRVALRLLPRLPLHRRQALRPPQHAAGRLRLRLLHLPLRGHRASFLVSRLVPRAARLTLTYTCSSSTSCACRARRSPPSSSCTVRRALRLLFFAVAPPGALADNAPYSHRLLVVLEPGECRFNAAARLGDACGRSESALADLRSAGPSPSSSTSPRPFPVHRAVLIAYRKPPSSHAPNATGPANRRPSSHRFLVAGECFPASVRSTARASLSPSFSFCQRCLTLLTRADGFSAAAGKLGALLPTVVFHYLSDRNKFWFAMPFGALGFLVTAIFLPDTTGMELREIERASPPALVLLPAPRARLVRPALFMHRADVLLHAMQATGAAFVRVTPSCTTASPSTRTTSRGTSASSSSATGTTTRSRTSSTASRSCASCTSRTSSRARTRRASRTTSTTRSSRPTWSATSRTRRRPPSGSSARSPRSAPSAARCRTRRRRCTARGSRSRSAAVREEAF